MDSGTKDQLIENMARAMMPKDILAQASSMHLCLHVHPQWVCATVADAAGGQVAWSEEFPLAHPTTDSYAEAVAFISEKNWGEKVFRKCSITFDTSDFALVPTAFFQKGKEQTLLQFQTGKTHPGATSLSLGELSAEFVFEMNMLVEGLTHKFPNARIFPSAYLLARFAHSQAEKLDSTLHVLYTKPYLFLAIVKNKELLLLNSYAAIGAEDVLYYTSNAAMQLGIDLEHAAIKLYAHADTAHLQTLFQDYTKGLQVVSIDRGIAHPIITHMHIVCV